MPSSSRRKSDVVWSVAGRMIYGLVLLFVAVLMGNAVAADPGVAAAQAKLRELGYDPGPADGACGPKTVEAIKRFQGDCKLSATGELDEQTREKLGISAPKVDTATQHAPGANASAKEASKGKQISFRGKVVGVGLDVASGKGTRYVSTFEPVGEGNPKSLPRYLRLRTTPGAHPKDIASGDVYDISATLGTEERDAALGISVVMLNNARLKKVTDPSGAKK